MGITQCILKKKTKIKKKNDLVIYSLNCKSMVKQPHLNTFEIYCHNVVPEIAKPHMTQQLVKKKTLTNYTSTSRSIIICKIHDILRNQKTRPDKITGLHILRSFIKKSKS